MAEEGQLFEAPDGNTLRLVRITDELLEMEATYSGEGAMPPPHLHPAQDERFEVLEGAVTAILDGEEHRHEAGEAFDVPAASRPSSGSPPSRRALRILGFVLALFLAYVVGRAAGILLGIGPYVTEAIAIAAVVAVFVVRSRRR